MIKTKNMKSEYACMLHEPAQPVVVVAAKEEPNTGILQ